MGLSLSLSLNDNDNEYQDGYLGGAESWLRLTVTYGVLDDTAGSDWSLPRALFTQRNPVIQV